MANRSRGWRRRFRHLHSDRGAGAIEYAGLVIIVAAIILAVRGLGLDTAIAAGIATSVNSVLGGGE